MLKPYLEEERVQINESLCSYESNMKVIFKNDLSK